MKIILSNPNGYKKTDSASGILGEMAKTKINCRPFSLGDRFCENLTTIVYEVSAIGPSSLGLRDKSSEVFSFLIIQTGQYMPGFTLVEQEICLL